MGEDFFKRVEKNIWLSFVSAIALSTLFLVWFLDKLPEKLQDVISSSVWGIIVLCVMLWAVVIVACWKKGMNCITTIRTKKIIRKTNNAYDLMLFQKGLENYPNSFENISTTDSSNLIDSGIFKRGTGFIGYIDHGTNELIELITLDKKYCKAVKKRINKYNREK
ncbi:hypothetical protein ACRHK7_00350 [Weissella tructae]|uniref:hypothetical protein n=1 Tax=Weissella tructae TaxID=887702 RepID=UPI003D8DF6C8